MLIGFLLLLFETLCTSCTFFFFLLPLIGAFIQETSQSVRPKCFFLNRFRVRGYVTLFVTVQMVVN